MFMLGVEKRGAIEREEGRKREIKQECDFASFPHICIGLFQNNVLVYKLCHSFYLLFSGGRKMSPTGVCKVKIVKPVFSTAEPNKKFQHTCTQDATSGPT